MFVYTIQPVVKPVWQPVWQTPVSCIQPVVNPVVQPGLTTGWTNNGCSLNTVEWTVAVRSTRLSNRLYVKPVVEPVWQPVVSCKRGIRSRALSTRQRRRRPAWRRLGGRAPGNASWISARCAAGSWRRRACDRRPDARSTRRASCDVRNSTTCCTCSAGRRLLSWSARAPATGEPRRRRSLAPPIQVKQHQLVANY